MINNLRQDIFEFLRLAYYHEDSNKSIVTDEIIKLIEKRINEIKVDHTPVGECPECDSQILKQFMEMIKK